MKLNDSQLGKPEVLYKNTLANIMAISGTEGMVAWATDAKCRMIYDGAWKIDKQGFLFSPPSQTGYAWYNQGNATLTVNNDLTWSFYVPNEADGNYHMYVKNIPTAPFSYTILICNYPIAQYNSIGIVLRNSSDNKYIINTHMWSSGAYGIWTGVPGVADYGGPYAGIEALAWLRYTDTGTTRTWSASNDGVVFRPLSTQANTTYTTPDKIGIVVAARTSSYPAYSRLLSIVES